MIARDHGAALLETVVALAMTAVVVAAALSLLNPNQLAAQAQDEATDMTQRARVAMDAMVRDIAMAGAGVASGPRRGGLNRRFAPVVPRRVGLSGADVPTIARADAISVVYVPVTYAQTVSGAQVTAVSGATLAAAPNCVVGQAACGLQTGMTAIVFDDSGAYDMFRVTAAQGDTAQLRPHNAAMGYTYAPGATVAQAESRTYYLDSATNQLRQYDGYLSDVPVADNVVGLELEYFDAAMSSMPLTVFSDGPWKGSGATAFDEDLLRVRAIRISVRIQAALPAFRAIGPAFVQPGTSRNAARALSDLVATTIVAPINLGLA